MSEAGPTRCQKLVPNREGTPHNQNRVLRRVSTRDQNLALQVHAARDLGIKTENIFIEKTSGKDIINERFSLEAKNSCLRIPKT